MNGRHYVLQCRACDAAFADDGVILDCTKSHQPGLLGTEYEATAFEPDATADGIYRYRRWLPVVRPLLGSARTVTYQSERLSRLVGLPNLWVAFNGYWPEKSAAFQTTTFKDLEAWTVLCPLAARARRHPRHRLRGQHGRGLRARVFDERHRLSRDRAGGGVGRAAVP
jgi:cysteate synthase